MTQGIKDLWNKKIRAGVVVALGLVIGVMPAFSANVTARGGATRPAVSRGAASATVRNTVAPATTPAADIVTEQVVETTVVTEPEPQPMIIEDRSAMFEEAMSAVGQGTKSADEDALGTAIRRQRASLDAADAIQAAEQTQVLGGAILCDQKLRACMAKKCSDNKFSGCAGDGDTIWSDKLNSCRRETECTAKEFNLFVDEIRADRDHYARLANYQNIYDCGNNYNKCIISTCGIQMTQCLGKTAADKAIAKCNSDLKECTTRVDNGLAARTGEVLANLRVDAEKQIQQDEKRLTALRDQMATKCQGMGAMFDERTFDCVFTVNFYADKETKPFASRKRYAGMSFDCNQDWFGVNITTFKENAYRRTREQESATMQFMGGGLGIAAGGFASGAINRAMDSQKASKAVKKAEAEKEAESKENAAANKSMADQVIKNNETVDKAVSDLETQAQKDAVAKQNSKENRELNKEIRKTNKIQQRLAQQIDAQAKDARGIDDELVIDNKVVDTSND